jgi:tetratricopeptide (TPR) repeat protein
MPFGRSQKPATRLQAVRFELGWTALRAIHELRLAGARASANSLKTMLSRWENGHGGKDPETIRLFCQAYARTPEELGLARDDSDTLVQAIRVVPSVGPEMVTYFRNVFGEHLRADNLMGPHHLVDVVYAQASLLDQMLPNAIGQVRRELLTLAFRYNELTGWLCQDAGNPERAMRHTDRSMDYSLELGGQREMSYALMRKADIAADLGKPDRVIGLTDAALRNPKEVPPRLKALVFRLQGRAYAELGNADECARAIDAAQTEASRPYDSPDDLTAYCTPSYIGMEAAVCWTRLGRFDPAIATYERSLAAWPESMRRDHGLCLARLASAYAGREDVDRACVTGRRAVEVIRTATSSRALVELQRARIRLAPWRRHAEVSDLNDRIRTLIQPAA